MENKVASFALGRARSGEGATTIFTASNHNFGDERGFRSKTGGQQEGMHHLLLIPDPIFQQAIYQRRGMSGAIAAKDAVEILKML
jgi:hypothetical protein